MINTPHTPQYRIGMGYDVHKLAEGQAFWLGGIQIEHTHGAVGHSDADVLIHAICDALLGAANLGDIGAHFPDTEQQYKGIDSKILLARVLEVIREHKYEVVNIDSTVCLQTPKLRNHIAGMQQTLSEVMKVRVEDISIKATTTERLGFVGRQEGVSAYAVAMLYRTTPATDTDFQTYNRL